MQPRTGAHAHDTGMALTRQHACRIVDQQSRLLKGPMSSPCRSDPEHVTQVYPAGSFRVTSGANLGDAIEDLENLCLGDTYRLARTASLEDLLFSTSADGRPPKVAPSSGFGAPGQSLGLLARLRFMSSGGAEAEALLIKLDGGTAGLEALCILPLRGLSPGTTGSLIGIDRAGGSIPHQNTSMLGFARGTRISRADGGLVPVEDLQIGDLLLTRDNGAQPLRYVHRRTVPASGAETPVVIPPQRLGNPREIVLAHHQRLFFYQQGTDRLADVSEVLVRAGGLVGHHGANRRKGGYVEYFALVLDEHEILYAEGVPCESVELSPHAKERLPDEMANQLPDFTHLPHIAQEAGDDALRALTQALLAGDSVARERP